MTMEESVETQEIPETMEEDHEMEKIYMAEQEQEQEKDENEEEEEDEEESLRGIIDMSSVSGIDLEEDGSGSNIEELQDKPLSQQLQLLRDTYGYGLQWKGSIESMMKRSVKRFSIPLPMMATCDSSKKSMKRKMARVRWPEHAMVCEDIKAMKPSWRNFEYKELAAATDNFNPENLLGKGGHAEVYKGCLSDGLVVAVKRLMKNDKHEEDRIQDYLSELGIIAHINHHNAAQLLGFGIDGGFHLVLQFSPNGSLASILHDSEESPSWSIRFKVAVGVAEGLRYLHHECQRRIIHRDIKASNILLTQDYEALISDFGLAKWLPDNCNNHVVHNLEGTVGYLAPEYFMHGVVNEKTDVFAYGVLLLEIITGRHAIDTSRQSLVMWAKPLLESINVKELIDPRLGDDYDVAEVKRAMFTASLCIHHLSASRPHMNLIVQLLKGDIGMFDLKRGPMEEKSSLPDGLDMEDHTCSNYLKTLSRHMELVLE